MGSNIATEATFGNLTKRTLNFANTSGIGFIQQLPEMKFKSNPLVSENPTEPVLENLRKDNGGVEVLS